MLKDTSWIDGCAKRILSRLAILGIRTEVRATTRPGRFRYHYIVSRSQTLSPQGAYRLVDKRPTAKGSGLK